MSDTHIIGKPLVLAEDQWELVLSATRGVTILCENTKVLAMSRWVLRCLDCCVVRRGSRGVSRTVVGDHRPNFNKIVDPEDKSARRREKAQRQQLESHQY